MLQLVIGLALIYVLIIIRIIVLVTAIKLDSRKKDTQKSEVKHEQQVAKRDGWLEANLYLMNARRELEEKQKK